MVGDYQSTAQDSLGKWDEVQPVAIVALGPNVNLGGESDGLTDAQLRAAPVPVADPAMGEVTANPAANTILGRLKAIATALVGVVLGSGEAHIGAVGGHTIRANAQFVRPADVTQYATGDIIANAGVVVPMEFTIGRDLASRGGMVRRARLRKTGATIANANFRLHLYASLPTAIPLDNAVWMTGNVAGYVGSIDIACDKLFTDGAAGNGVPTVGGEINFTADKYYGLLEARSPYTPANGETFVLTLEALQN